MSSREKNLLSLLFVAGFIILNVVLYSWYVDKKSLSDSQLTATKAQLQRAIALQNSSEELTLEMEWLAKNEPETSAYQTVQNELQQFSQAQALNLGLNIKNQDLLATDTSGVHFNRAQFKIFLTGKEQALYRWLDAINDPTSFRSAYQIRLSPNGLDDTQIDCTAILSQWFAPSDSDL